MANEQGYDKYFPYAQGRVTGHCAKGLQKVACPEPERKRELELASRRIRLGARFAYTAECFPELTKKPAAPLPPYKRTKKPKDERDVWSKMK